MAKPNGNHNRGRGRNRGPRTNEKIRAREVRLLGPDGAQIGLATRDEALRLAKKWGLDLVEISPTARPPVCRILDFGKYKYELSKKNKDKSASTTKIKEIKFRVRVGEHDYMTKLRRGEEFLYKGNKLKLSLMFRGREMEHRDLGFDVIKRAIKDLEHVGTADGQPRAAGRNIMLTMSPMPENKRRLIYNENVTEGDSPDDSQEDNSDSGDE